MDKNENENFMYCFKHHAFSLLHKVGIKGKDIKNKLFLYVIKITTSASKKVDAVNFQIKQLLENRQNKKMLYKFYVAKVLKVVQLSSKLY